MLERLNIGIVGACSRGASFQTGFAARPEARVHAVCDLDAEGLPEAASAFKASEQYTDYQQMLSSSPRPCPCTPSSPLWLCRRVCMC